MTTNQGIKNILDKQIQNGRVAHAYLFVGPKGTGKKELAMEFAMQVLENHGTTRNFTRNNTEFLERHPDFAMLDCSQDASAESVREFIGRIALKPFLGKKKFALIINIENLNTQGANALLKTLEEPPDSTVMVLTADSRKILPTIVSRCQVFSFSRVLATDLKRNAPEAPSLIGLAEKSLGERLVAISQFAAVEEAVLKNSIEDFIYTAARQLSSEPAKYYQLAAGLKAYEDLSTNKNRKLILQGLLTRL